MTKQSEITLDDLTSALKAIYGRETEAVLLIFLHWEKNNHDIANAAPEVLQEIKEGYLEKYHAAAPLERPDALELLGAYGEHFFKTATPKERAAFAIAIGRTPLEYEIMGEGFSLRDLMQALKALEAHNGPAPEKMPALQLIELHSVPLSTGLAGHRIGVSQSGAVATALHGRRLATKICFASILRKSRGEYISPVYRRKPSRSSC